MSQQPLKSAQGSIEWRDLIPLIQGVSSGRLAVGPEMSRQYSTTVTVEALAILLEHRSGPLVDRCTRESIQLKDLGLIEWTDDLGGSRLTTRGAMLCSFLEDEANRLLHTTLKPPRKVVLMAVKPEKHLSQQRWWRLNLPELGNLGLKYHYVEKGMGWTICGVRLSRDVQVYKGRGDTQGRKQMDKCSRCTRVLTEIADKYWGRKRFAG